MNYDDACKIAAWLRDQIGKLRERYDAQAIEENILRLEKELKDLEARYGINGSAQPETTHTTSQLNHIAKAGIVLFITFFLGACSVFDEAAVGPPAFQARTAGENCRLAIEYHGIRHAYTIDETGFWFERDGKRCRVWTKGCLDYVRSKKTGAHLSGPGRAVKSKSGGPSGARALRRLQ